VTTAAAEANNMAVVATKIPLRKFIVGRSLSGGLLSLELVVEKL
jgi:hypothetical protein